MLGVLSQKPLSVRPNASGANHLRLLPCRAPKSTAFKLFCRKLALPMEAPSKSDAIADLLREYGFLPNQIDSILLCKQYNFLSRTAATAIKPKLDYLLSFGYSRSELIRLICREPNILTAHLKRRLIHNHSLLKTLLGSEELVKKAVLRTPPLFSCDLEKSLIPNVQTLRANRVPPELIIDAIVSGDRAVIYNPDTFAGAVKQVKMLGFDSSSKKFITATKAKAQSAWDRKVELFKSCGWSDKNFLSAFFKYPEFMWNSEQKIKKMMEFYVDKLGWDPVFLSEQPYFIKHSLENRVIPRSLVLDVLAERGLLGGKMELHRIFVLCDRQFEAEYVKFYEKRIPEVLEAYHQNAVENDLKALRSWQEKNKQTAICPRNPNFLPPSLM